MEPQMIMPTTSLIVTFDPNGITEAYSNFIMGEFVPKLYEQGLYFTEAWHTAYGNYPLRMVVFVTDDEKKVEKLINSRLWEELSNQLLTYASGVGFRVKPYKKGFQFVP